MLLPSGPLGENAAAGPEPAARYGGGACACRTRQRAWRPAVRGGWRETRPGRIVAAARRGPATATPAPRPHATRRASGRRGCTRETKNERIWRCVCRKIYRGDARVSILSGAPSPSYTILSTVGFRLTFPWSRVRFKAPPETCNTRDLRESAEYTRHGAAFCLCRSDSGGLLTGGGEGCYHRRAAPARSVGVRGPENARPLAHSGRHNRSASAARRGRTPAGHGMGRKQAFCACGGRSGSMLGRRKRAGASGGTAAPRKAADSCQAPGAWRTDAAIGAEKDGRRTNGGMPPRRGRPPMQLGWG